MRSARACPTHSSPLRRCKLSAVFWSVSDRFFTPLHSFCRLLPRIRPFLYSAVNFLPFFRLRAFCPHFLSAPSVRAAVNFLSLFRSFATVSLLRCAVSAVSSGSALLLAPSVRTHVKFLPFFGSFSTFPLHSCAVFAAFSRVSDFFFTPLHSFCRFIALIRPKLYTAAQFLPFFRFFATFPLRDCTVSAVLPIPHLLSLPFIHNAKNLFTHE